MCIPSRSTPSPSTAPTRLCIPSSINIGILFLGPLLQAHRTSRTLQPQLSPSIPAGFQPPSGREILSPTGRLLPPLQVDFKYGGGMSKHLFAREGKLYMPKAYRLSGSIKNTSSQASSLWVFLLGLIPLNHISKGPGGEMLREIIDDHIKKQLTIIAIRACDEARSKLVDFKAALSQH